MDYTKEMCCFCLNTSNVLIDLFSKSGDLTHFDKISSSLSQLANVLNELGHNEYMFCVKCCETIHMIYQFNRTCLNNVKTLYTSQKEILKAETEQSLTTGLSDVQHENKDETLFIKTETSLDSLFNDDTTKALNGSHGVLVKEETDNPSNMMDICQVEMTEDKQNTAEPTVIYAEYEAIKKNIEMSNLKEITERTTISERNWYEFQGSSGLIFENAHMNNCIDGYTCDLCNETFPKKGELSKHRMIHGVKPYVCPMCGKKFNRKEHLERHMIVHTDEKPHKCESCSKAFKRAEHLDRHKLIHSGAKPFPCEACNKRFRDKSDLAKHRKIHIEKPFSCLICCKSFNQVAILNRHKLIHQTITHIS